MRLALTEHQDKSQTMTITFDNGRVWNLVVNYDGITTTLPTFANELRMLADAMESKESPTYRVRWVGDNG